MQNIVLQRGKGFLQGWNSEIRVTGQIRIAGSEGAERNLTGKKGGKSFKGGGQKAICTNFPIGTGNRKLVQKRNFVLGGRKLVNDSGQNTAGGRRTQIHLPKGIVNPPFSVGENQIGGAPHNLNDQPLFHRFVKIVFTVETKNQNPFQTGLNRFDQTGRSKMLPQKHTEIRCVSGILLGISHPLHAGRGRVCRQKQAAVLPFGIEKQNHFIPLRLGDAIQTGASVIGKFVLEGPKHNTVNRHSVNVLLLVLKRFYGIGKIGIQNLKGGICF